MQQRKYGEYNIAITSLQTFINVLFLPQNGTSLNLFTPFSHMGEEKRETLKLEETGTLECMEGPFLVKSSLWVNKRTH